MCVCVCMCMCDVHVCVCVCVCVCVVCINVKKRSSTVKCLKYHCFLFAFGYVSDIYDVHGVCCDFILHCSSD